MTTPNVVLLISVSNARHPVTIVSIFDCVALHFFMYRMCIKCCI